MAASGKKKTSAKRTSAAAALNKNKGLEATVAALLLTGKLRVDSFQVFRDASLVVGLVGKYNTLNGSANNNVDKIVSFMNENSGITVSDLMDAVKKKINNDND